MDRPGGSFVPRTRGAVEGLRGERFLEHLVMFWQVLIAVLSLMQVVVDVQLAEIGTSKEGVASPNKITSDLQPLGWSGFIGVHPEKIMRVGRNAKREKRRSLAACAFPRPTTSPFTRAKAAEMTLRLSRS